MIPLRLILTVLLAASVLGADAIDPKHELLVIARADDPTHPTEMIGNSSLLAKRGSPASTIKVPLSLMGLQEKVISLESSYICGDRTSMPSPLTLRQAMDLSSNEYFEQLVKNLGIPRLETFLSRWKYFPLSEKSLPPPPRIARGKAFVVSPQDQLDFLSQLVLRKVEGVGQPAYDLLDTVLAQPERPGLYGKTGSDREGSWYVAYSRDAATPFIYVLRSDLPNSDGKRLKKILLEHIGQDAGTKPQS